MTMNLLKASALVLIFVSDFIVTLLGLSVTCKTQFSDLKHSITSILCPANCWEENPSLCGNGVYTSGPICLAAMYDQQIDNSGGPVQVFRNPGRGAQLYGKDRNGVQTQTCSASKYSYTFSMTCKTTGNCELPITHVYCPAKCTGASYTYTSGKYFTNSSVCAAAKRRGAISVAGGKVVIYAMTAKAYNGTNTTNTDWFSFEDFDVCSYVNPCANNGTCVDLLADYGCLCPEKYSGRNCETMIESTLNNNRPANQGLISNDEGVVLEGGWTVFQKRFDGSVNFGRNWQEYKDGFGDMRGEFWLGLEKINRMTSGQRCSLRIDLRGFDDSTAFAQYTSFAIDGESDNYRLHVSGYSGTAGDSLKGHNGMQFSTQDQDHDTSASNCALMWESGWWFTSCFDSKLNGNWGRSTGNWQNMIWSHWKADNAIKGSTMKIRCD